jgi:hypothetical protein
MRRLLRVKDECGTRKAEGGTRNDEDWKLKVGKKGCLTFSSGTEINEQVNN